MKITLIQSELIWGECKKNLEKFDRKLAGCDAGDIILLPEMFVSGCTMVKKSPEVALAEKKALADAYPVVEESMLSWAGRQDALVIGSTVYRENERFYNRLVAAFPEGKCRYYDKRHCFRMGGENEYFSAGNRQLVFEFRGIKIALFICYDLRFPVWCRNTQNYDLAVFVANWPESRREAWRTLLKARAIENQSFVAGVNCVGMDNNNLKYAGDSMVVDAWGNEIAGTFPGKEEVISTELDLEGLRRYREKFPVLLDRDGFLLQ